MTHVVATNIYRRVSCRLWADERFRKLSAPKPNAQTLWFHLLFGEQTGIVPGLFRIGEAAFAEQLGWPMRSFRAAFTEIESAGMVSVDWNSRLIWVPNAIRYNPPASPNVVRHWGIEWHLLPECEMRSKAQVSLEAYLQGMGKGFVQAFNEVLSGVFTKVSGEDLVQSGAVAVTGSNPLPLSKGDRLSPPEKPRSRRQNGAEEATRTTPGLEVTARMLDEKDRPWREGKARADPESRVWLHERWPDKYPSAEDPKWDAE